MIGKFSKDEKLALAGLLKWVVSADHENSLDGIEAFFQENGWGRFDKIYMEADDKFQDLDGLKDFVTTITNKAAQEIIIQIAKDIMTSDVLITKEEKDVLAFLNKIWNK